MKKIENRINLLKKLKIKVKIHPDYDYKTTKFKSSKENNDPLNLSKVVVRQSGSGYFVLNQKNTRIYRNLKDPEY